MAWIRSVVCDGCDRTEKEAKELEPVNVNLPNRRVVAEDDSVVTVRLDLCVRCLSPLARLVAANKASEAAERLTAWAKKQKA